MNDLVKNKSGELITTSKIISDVFGKAHRDTVRAINNLDCSEEFKVNNFKSSTYTTSQNKELECFDMTLDGVLFLCMAFTGVKASLKREALLEAFKSSVSFNIILDAISNIDIDDPDLFIYIAQECESGRYKIGISKHPEKRVAQLNTGNPEVLHLIHQHKASDGFKEESAIHRMLENNSLNGEWFDNETDLSNLLSK